MAASASANGRLPPPQMIASAVSPFDASVVRPLMASRSYRGVCIGVVAGRRHHRRALAALPDERHDFSDHRIVGKFLAGAFETLGECIVTEKQHLVGAADAVEIGAAELAPFQSDHIEPDQLSLWPERKSKRNDIAGDPAHAAQHRAL